MNLSTGPNSDPASPQATQLWRSLAVSLSEGIPFEPELRREILRKLVLTWREEPSFDTPTASLLLKLGEPEHELQSEFAEILKNLGPGETPIEALVVLRLRIRLLGWPTEEPQECDRILRELRILLGGSSQTGPTEDLMVAVAEFAADAGLENLSAHSDGQRCLQYLRHWWQGQMQNPERRVAARSTAGTLLGRLGDPRPGVNWAGTAGKGQPFVWCGPGGEFSEIRDFSHGFPARRFMMGGDREAYGSFPIALACTRLQTRYYLAKYPVTVSQYSQFIAAGGYGDPAGPRPSWWSEAGWAWLIGATGSRHWPDWLREEYEDAVFPIRGPRSYAPVFQTPNHPQVGVSWFEATAYCAWLNSSEIRPWLKLPANASVRLPSEAEWEQAARWSQASGQVDGRPFPWDSAGSPMPRPADFSERCNWGKTGIGHTSPVGMFPKGNSDCGIADLAGNVWEWCQTKWSRSGEQWSAKEYNDLRNGLDDEDGDLDRVLRGGSWHYAHPAALRSAIRYFSPPAGRISSIGFRLVCVVGSPSR
jgi:formylglycine-generating enzyme required for sulfatase activity